MGKTEKIFFSLCLIIVSANGAMSSYSFGQFGVASEEETNSTWPTKMTFHETKTNYMLGSTLLRRLYGRIDHMENLFKIELNQVYEKLRDQIEKNFRKCDRQRRRADTSKLQNGTNNPKGFYGDKQSNRKDREGKKAGNKDKRGKKDRKQSNEGHASSVGHNY